MVQHQAAGWWILTDAEVEVEDFVKRAKALTKEIEESAVKHGEVETDPATIGDNGRETMVVSPWWKVAAERDEILLPRFFLGGGL